MATECTVDSRTLAYYRSHAAELSERYEAVASPVARYFPLAFVTGSRVLDVGAGSGRDLAALVAAGFDGHGIEPTDEFREAALQHHPELAGRLLAGALPDLGEPFGGQFDGVLCSAVLMHLAEADLFDAALAIRRILKPHGRLLLSIPAARDDVGADERDAHGRLFKGYAAEELQLLCERLGFQRIGRWDNDDAQQRSGIRWTTLLLELQSSQGLRAVDQIEGILNRDRKVATYKFALFRALAEIATQEPRTARWLPNGKVAVPIDRIAERWLRYYWPIFASPQPIPQSQSEGAGPNQPIAFRAPLQALMQAFAQQGEHGGLAAWHAASSAGQLDTHLKRLHRQALQSIASAIRSGPVTYAGGALDSGRVFQFDGASRSVLMSAELWRELSLLGHWIIDAVIVRWAALTERFGHRQGIRSGDVLPLLLARPDPDRVTAVARGIYLAAHADRCVWSGRHLAARNFVVDHAIPFSLWGNNDLWNLLPADAGINARKSDRLPTGELLKARQAPILDSWRLTREAMPQAFDRQASLLLGHELTKGKAWEGELFARLREAIELTALQRGIERWSGQAAVAA
jgi:SAM-dependent methyltransferase